MGRDFDELLAQIDAEAAERGPAAVEMLRVLGANFVFAVELVTARKRACLTQTQLAQASGIPQSEISRFERGQGNPTLETMGRLFASLGRRIASEARAA